jgi:hypothetical protein
VTIEVVLLDGMHGVEALVFAIDHAPFVHRHWNVIVAHGGNATNGCSVPGALEDTLSAIGAVVLLTNHRDIGKWLGLPILWQLKTALDDKLVTRVVVVIASPNQVGAKGDGN